jgi:hypothetical protein
MAVGRLLLADFWLIRCQGTSAGGKSKSSTDSFTHKELRDLFSFDPNTACGTHDLLQCPCETHKQRPPDVDEGNSTVDEYAEDEEAQTAQGENGQVHKFIDMDSSDSEPDMGFVFATQVKPDKYEKAVSPRSLLQFPNYHLAMPSTRNEGTKPLPPSGNGLILTVSALLPLMKSKTKFWAKSFTSQRRKVKVKHYNSTSTLLQLK